MHPPAFQLSVLQVALNYFPTITYDTFPDLFKSNSNTVEILCNSDTSLIRNVLIVLFHLKHYLPIRATAVLFHLKKSSISQIVDDTLSRIVRQLEDKYISMAFRQVNQVPEFTETFTAIDCTEVEVWRYLDHHGGYSGKKKAFTLKYQLIVGAITGTIHHVYGPEIGSVHDAEILSRSQMDNWFYKHNEYALGDRGYEGCLNIVSPIKNFGDPLSPAEERYNTNIGHYRNIVERVFGSLKKWHILKRTFRGNLIQHHNVFIACCILNTIGS